ncbi:TPA: PTS sugar transporter subunit IIB, partial [Clostridioides difficile]|nr:PTS sugar transporter subunit IIB [Clostridioides difficile]
MIKIMLACSAGMSTSLLVTKMESAAKENGIESQIWAIPESTIQNEIEKCDVLLLGPQVRYVLPKAQEIARPYNIPVEVI